MNLLVGIIGFIAGLAIADIMNEERIKAARKDAAKARQEHLSAIEHEAHLRAAYENVCEANEYFKAEHCKRYLYD